MSISMALLGCGAFGSMFMRHFKHHPLVTRFALCDMVPEKLDKLGDDNGIAERYDSLDKLCDSDIDAVAIFSQPWRHVEQAVQLMKAGKHVYSAVPAAQSLEECEALVKTVTETHRIYMMGETSIYRPQAAYLRKRAAAGDFGHIVEVEAEYMHDMDHGLYDVERTRWGNNSGRDKTGSGPFLYPTHSISFAMTINGALPGVKEAGGVYCKSVSCLGYQMPGDDWYRLDTMYHNPYSSEVALLEMSNGSIARICEMRRCGMPCAERCVRVVGTEASYEENFGSVLWATKHNFERITPPLDFEPLPDVMKNDLGEHGGSHAHLANEFVTAVNDKRLPHMNVWEAVRTFAPGFMAHQSAMQGGKRLPVPDWGAPIPY